MAQVVFGMEMDSTTVECLSELRLRKRGVILSQLEDIEPTLNQLIATGALREEEKSAYAPRLRDKLLKRLELLEHRMKDPDTFYEDELSYYLSLLEA